MKRMVIMLLVLSVMLSLCGCAQGNAGAESAGAEIRETQQKSCDHSFLVEAVYTAGCDYEGSVVISCQVCSESYTAVQPALGHDWLDADCVNPKTCRICGQTEGAVLEHSFSEGECVVCGAPDPDNSVTWELSKGVLTISGVGRMKDENPWWEYRSSISEIVISDGITYIGISAFNHTDITELTLPDSVTSMGERAFYWNDELTKVVLPDGITILPDSCFGQCAKLKDVTFPKSLKEIGYYAFGCSAITDLILPDSVEVIGETAFGYSYKLKTVEIPGSVRTIGNSAFLNCTSLHTVTIYEGAVSIGYKAFGNCPSLTKIHIPASVETIDEYAFEDSEKVVIYAPAGSYAESFAAENGIQFVAE